MCDGLFKEDPPASQGFYFGESRFCAKLPMKKNLLPVGELEENVGQRYKGIKLTSFAALMLAWCIYLCIPKPGSTALIALSNTEVCSQVISLADL